MTRSLCAFSGIAVTLAGALALSSPASADELKPGDKWLECYVGQGGFATHGELYGAVARALDAGDAGALGKLGWDRCAYYRAASLRGWQDAEAQSAELKALGPEAVLDLHARLQVEGVRLAESPGAEVKESSAASMHILGTGSALALGFSADRLDERWYLIGVPSFEGSGAPVVEKARRLFGSLGDALAKHKKKPAAARKALEGWWKKRGAELLQVVRAARTLYDEAQRAEYARQRRACLDRIGDLAADPGIAESLGLVLPAVATRVPIGVPECDAYLGDILRCAEQMPKEASEAMASALAQAADAWREAAKTPEGRASMIVACQAAIDAAREAMASLCPGVFDGKAP